MYISLATIFFVVVIIIIVNALQNGASAHRRAMTKKKSLIKEAERVVSSMNNLSWDEMTQGQKNVYECAMERLKMLRSFKKNHAPDSYPSMREWPKWFDPNKNS